MFPDAFWSIKCKAERAISGSQQLKRLSPDHFRGTAFVEPSLQILVHARLIVAIYGWGVAYI
jgi:hypothetical protein